MPREHFIAFFLIVLLGAEVVEMVSSEREAKPSLGAPEKSIGDLFRLDGRTVLGELQYPSHRKAADRQKSPEVVVL